MMRKLTFGLLIAWALSSAQAQDLEKARQALAIVSEFAAAMCGSPKDYGSSNSLELSATGKAEVSKIVKKLVDLNFQGAAKYQTEEYQGFLRKDLAPALKDNSTCKLKVFGELKDKLIPNL